MDHSPVPTSQTSSSDSFSGLSNIQVAVLNVLCSCEGIPKYSEIARQLDLNPSTVSRAINDDKFQRIYQKICLNTAGMRFREVMDSVTNMAIAGSAPHAKIYLQTQKVLHDKTHDKPLPPPDTKQNVDELLAKKKEIESDLKKRFEDEKTILNASFEEEE